MCEAPQNLRSLALLSPESKAVRCCVLDHNSDGVHSLQLERTSPVHRRDVRLLAATRSALANNRKHRQLLAAGLRRKILQAIQRHPEGVSIVEIGNELGVDFRRLLGSTDTLLASGQIDQVQELFYPAGR